jgi:hypothetical protein
MRHAPVGASTPHAVHETDREQVDRLTAELERLRPAGRRLLEVSEELGCARSQIAKLEGQLGERRTSEAEVQQLRDRLRAEMERSRGLEQRCDQVVVEAAQKKLAHQVTKKQERLTRLMYRLAGKDMRFAWERWKRYMIARSFEAQNETLKSELEKKTVALLRAEEQVAAALEAEAKLREIRNSYHLLKAEEELLDDDRLQSIASKLEASVADGERMAEHVRTLVAAENVRARELQQANEAVAELSQKLQAVSVRAEADARSAEQRIAELRAEQDGLKFTLGVAEGEKLQLLSARDALSAELRRLMGDVELAGPLSMRFTAPGADGAAQRASEHESELRLVRRLHDAQHALSNCEVGSPCHICTGTRLALPPLHRDWGSPAPHLRWDWAHPARICTATAGRPARRAHQVGGCRARTRARSCRGGDARGQGRGVSRQRRARTVAGARRAHSGDGAREGSSRRGEPSPGADVGRA